MSAIKKIGSCSGKEKKLIEVSEQMQVLYAKVHNMLWFSWSKFCKERIFYGNLFQRI